MRDKFAFVGLLMVVATLVSAASFAVDGNVTVNSSVAANNYYLQNGDFVLDNSTGNNYSGQWTQIGQVVNLGYGNCYNQSYLDLTGVSFSQCMLLGVNGNVNSSWYDGNVNLRCNAPAFPFVNKTYMVTAGYNVSLDEYALAFYCVDKRIDNNISLVSGQFNSSYSNEFGLNVSCVSQAMQNVTNNLTAGNNYSLVFGATPISAINVSCVFPPANYTILPGSAYVNGSFQVNCGSSLDVNSSSNTTGLNASTGTYFTVSSDPNNKVCKTMVRLLTRDAGVQELCFDAYSTYCGTGQVGDLMVKYSQGTIPSLKDYYDSVNKCLLDSLDANVRSKAQCDLELSNCNGWKTGAQNGTNSMADLMNPLIIVIIIVAAGGLYLWWDGKNQKRQELKIEHTSPAEASTQRVNSPLDSIKYFTAGGFGSPKPAVPVGPVKQDLDDYFKDRKSSTGN